MVMTSQEAARSTQMSKDDSVVELEESGESTPFCSRQPERSERVGLLGGYRFGKLKLLASGMGRRWSTFVRTVTKSPLARS
jgi:hypothetical protein